LIDHNDADPGAALEIFGWGLKVRGSGDGSPPVGSMGKAPVGGVGDEVAQKLKHFLKNHNHFTALFSGPPG